MTNLTFPRTDLIAGPCDVVYERGGGCNFGVRNTGRGQADPYECDACPQLAVVPAGETCHDERPGWEWTLGHNRENCPDCPKPGDTVTITGRVPVEYRTIQTVLLALSGPEHQACEDSHVYVTVTGDVALCIRKGDMWHIDVIASDALPGDRVLVLGPARNEP